MRGQMTHLDTDVLAEFRAGLITGRRGARITAHLGGCERCTALDQQLAGVRSLLASVPAPTMPDSVAHRLDTVLAAEVAQRHAAGHAAAQGEAAPADQAERAGRDGTRESPAPRRGAETAASGRWHCECSRPRPPSSCWARASTG